MRRYLVVDDNTSDLFGTAGMISNFGRVSIASSAVEALSKLNATRFDAVITDFNMPDVSGLELIRRIRTVDPIIPAIMISGFYDPEALKQFPAGGVSDFLEKPFTEQEIFDSLEGVLARRSQILEGAYLEHAKKELEFLGVHTQSVMSAMTAISDAIHEITDREEKLRSGVAASLRSNFVSLGLKNTRSHSNQRLSLARGQLSERL